MQTNWLLSVNLCLSALSVFKFFDNDEENLDPKFKDFSGTPTMTSSMVKLIDSVIDENKEVKDTASKELALIRQSLSKKRQDLRSDFQ
jgi:dsDNA-specific endonuclease/ATPase MutS2